MKQRIGCSHKVEVVHELSHDLLIEFTRLVSQNWWSPSNVGSYLATCHNEFLLFCD